MAIPFTDFELSEQSDPNWTPLNEEAQYLTDLEGVSGRVAVHEIGRTAAQNLPLRTTRVCYPSALTDEEMRARAPIMFVCQQHGKENAGRETLLQLVKELALTNDTALQGFLRNHPLIAVITTNPEGFPNDRNNGSGNNINRGWDTYREAENKAIAGVMRDVQPHMVLDMHGLFGSTSPMFQFAGSEQPSVHPDLRSISRELRDFGISSVESLGYDSVPFVESTDSPEFLHEGAGFRNMVSILFEIRDQSISAGLPRKEAVRVVKATLYRILGWHRENAYRVSEAVATANMASVTEGDQQAPVALPSIASAPIGYRMTSAQFAACSETLDVAGIRAYAIQGSTDRYVPMAQSTRNHIPLILDSAYSGNVVSATRVDEPPKLDAPERLTNVILTRLSDQVPVKAVMASNSSTLGVASLAPETDYGVTVGLQEGGDLGQASPQATFRTASSPTGEYDVQWRDTTTQKVTDVRGVEGTRYRIQNLDAVESYQFRVREVAGERASPWTPWINFTTSATPGEGITTSGSFEPGGAIVVSYTGFSSEPGASFTVADGESNTVTVAGTVVDNGDGSGAISGTMPTLQEAVTSGNSILFGPVTVTVGTETAPSDYAVPDGLTMVELEEPIEHYIDQNWTSPAEAGEQVLFDATNFTIDKHLNFEADAEGVYDFWYVNNAGTAYNPTITAQGLPGEPGTFTLTVGSVTTTETSIQTTLSSTGTGLDSYRYRVDGGSWVTTGASVSITGLTESTTYSIEFQALDNGGSVLDFRTISATTQADQGSGTPLMIVIGGVSTTETSLAYSLTYTGDSANKFHKYQYRVDSGAWQDTGSSLTITGLSPGTSYTVDVRALDSTGGVLDVASTTSQTDTSGTPTYPSPVNLSESLVTSTSARLSWERG